MLFIPLCTTVHTTIGVDLLSQKKRKKKIGMDLASTFFILGPNSIMGIYELVLHLPFGLVID